jgi:hypothetical protein
VTIGQQRYQQSVEKVLLTDDDASHLFPQRAYPSRIFGNDFA